MAAVAPAPQESVTALQPPGVVSADHTPSQFQFVNSVTFDGHMMYREKPEGPGDKTTCEKMGCMKQDTQERWYQNNSTYIGFDVSPDGGCCCGCCAKPRPTVVLDGTKVGVLEDEDTPAKCCSDADVPVLTLTKDGVPHYEIRVTKEASCPCACTEMYCERNCGCRACLSCTACCSCIGCCADIRCCQSCCPCFGGFPYCCMHCSICCGQPCCISPSCLALCCHGCCMDCTACCVSEPDRNWRILSQPIYASSSDSSVGQGTVVGSIDSLWYKKTKQSVTCNVPNATREEQAILMLIPWYMRDRNPEEIKFMKNYTAKQLKQTVTQQTFSEALTYLGISTS